MYCKISIAIIAVFFGYDFVSAQEHIPSSTTAAELWNPWTWFWPYAKAAAEGYRDYYDKAQKATNELYQQIYKTNAFPWVTGNWSFLSPSSQNGSGDSKPEAQGGNSQTNQENSEQYKPENSETGQEENKPQAEENQTGGDSGTGAQVEGNVQNDGTPVANADANVEGQEVQGKV